MGINNLDDVDLSVIPTAILNARLTLIQAAIAERLSGTKPDAVESFTINGRTEQRWASERLMAYESAIYRALAIQAQNTKNGLNMLDAGFSTPGAGPSSSRPRGF